jgi:hypothetical protein
VTDSDKRSSLLQHKIITAAKSVIVQAGGVQLSPLKNIAGDEHGSLFSSTVGDKEKSFITLTPVVALGSGW